MFCDNCDWEKSPTVHIFEWVRITSHSHHFLPFLYIHIPLNSIWIHIHIHSFEFEFNDDDVYGQWTPPQFFYNCNILFVCSILCRCFCVTTFKFRSARTNWIIACIIIEHVIGFLCFSRLSSSKRHLRIDVSFGVVFIFSLASLFMYVTLSTALAPAAVLI